MRSWKRWVVVAAVVAATTGWWSTARPRACGGIGFLAVNCDGIIIANQITQIAHMVTQIREMGFQLTAMNGVLDQTTELITSDDVGMGNIGRLREAMDERLDMEKLGDGLRTVGGVAGAWNQRIPGVTDAARWLDVLAAPGLGAPGSDTVLLGGKPATETIPAERSAFRLWPLPGPGASTPGRRAAREAIGALRDVGEGTATWRTLWEDMEAGLAPSISRQDLRALGLGYELTNRLVDVWRRAERLAGADLQHTHAVAEAASTLGVQVGETAAHQGALREDDLDNPLRAEQAVLSTLMSQTELLVAQAQLQAQVQAHAVRERYEAERERREQQAEWQAGMAAGAAAWDTRIADIRNERAARIAAHRAWPDPANW